MKTHILVQHVNMSNFLSNMTKLVSPSKIYLEI